MKWYWWAGIGVGGLLLGGFLNRKRVMENLENVKLGEYFTLAEFVRTSSGFDNIPTPEHIENLKLLVRNFFDPLRRAIGFPIYISSGYRQKDTKSQHGRGQAGDFQVHFKGKSKAEVLKLIQPKGWNESNIVWDAVNNCYELTNQTIINVIRQNRLPYDQLIDEERGVDFGGKWVLSTWVHASYNPSGSQRLQWMTRRDVTDTNPKEYQLIKTGYA